MESPDPLVTADVERNLDVAEALWRMAHREGSQEAESASPPEPPGPQACHEAAVSGQLLDNTTAVGRCSSVQQPQVTLEPGVMVEPCDEWEPNVAFNPLTLGCPFGLKTTGTSRRRMVKPGADYSRKSKVDNDTRRNSTPQIKLEPDVMLEPGTSHCYPDSETDSDTRNRINRFGHGGPSRPRSKGASKAKRVKPLARLEPEVKVEQRAEWDWEPDVTFEPRASVCSFSEMDDEARYDSTQGNPQITSAQSTQPSMQPGRGLFVRKRIKLEPDDSESADSTGSENPEQPDHADDWKIYMVAHTAQEPKNCSEIVSASSGTCSEPLRDKLRTKLTHRHENPQGEEQHALIRAGKEPYKCSQCDATFRAARALKRHMLTHTDQKQHTCTECGACFRFAKHLKSHKLIHLDQSPKKCTVCDASFRDTFSLKSHMLTHTDERPYKCTQCDASFRWVKNLKAHMLIHTGEKPHKCTLCDASFRYHYSLKSHLLNHTGEKPHKCTECDASFKRSTYLKTHMLVHTQEKPHKCTQCEATFKRINDLKRHVLGHTGQKPYKCLQCDISCRDAFAFKNHMMTHTDEKPHRCTQCGASFRQKQTLKDHMLTHTGERPYKCTQCDASFRWVANLRSHMLVHNGKKIHTCTHCGASFRCSRNYRAHMFSHSGEMPHYKCTQCGATFGRSDYLKRHMMSHTSQNTSQMCTV